MITARQWDMVNYCEQFWYTFGKFPSNEQIYENVDDYDSPIQVAKDLELDHVKKQLEIRGIDFQAAMEVRDSPNSKKGLPARRNSNRLSEQQIAAIHTLLNVADNRSIQSKLTSLGVSYVTFQGWLKNKKFFEYYKRQAESMLQEGLPSAHIALLQQAAKGNLRAIELYYKMTGYYTGVESQELMNMKVFIHKLIEIIQKKVDDPAVLKEISQEMLGLIGMRDLEMAPPVANNAILLGEIENGSYT